MTADIGNRSVWFQADASNTSGTRPSSSGSDAPSTIDDNFRAIMGAVAREWDHSHYTLTSTGTSTAYVLTYSTAPVAYYNGQIFSFIVDEACGSAPTVNVNTLGDVTVKKLVAGTLTDLAANDWLANDRVSIAYNSTGPVLVWVNPKSTPPSSATTSAEGIVELLTTTELLTGTDTTRAATADSVAALWEANTTDITDGATITIGEGHYFNLITSTTAITAFSITTDRIGREFWVKFNTSRTLTHNATSLEIIEGAASQSVASGWYALIQSKGGGNVRVLKIVKPDGTAVVVNPATSMTLITTLNPTSGTSVTVTSGITSAYRKLYLEVENVSATSNTSLLTLEVSGNGGTNYGTASTIGEALTTATNLWAGYAEIGNIQTTVQSGAALFSNVHLYNSTHVLVTLNTSPVRTAIKNATGAGNPIDAIRISCAVAGTFDGSGVIRVYGVS